MVTLKVVCGKLKCPLKVYLCCIVGAHSPLGIFYRLFILYTTREGGGYSTHIVNILLYYTYYISRVIDIVSIEGHHTQPIFDHFISPHTLKFFIHNSYKYACMCVSVCKCVCVSARVEVVSSIGSEYEWCILVVSSSE